MTRELIINTIKSYEKRQGVSINKDTIQTEIINLTCKYILQHHRERIRQVDNAYAVGQVIQYNIMSVGDIIFDFVETCQELYPYITNERNPYANLTWEESMVQLIAQNICWSGMWGFLREYYLNSHGINIDNINVEVLTYNSGRHERYENKNFISESTHNRIIKLSFINSRKEVSISIEPSLSPKTAYLKDIVSNKVFEYEGDDRDYRFVVQYDDFGDICRFELFMPARNLRIVYYER